MNIVGCCLFAQFVFFESVHLIERIDFFIAGRYFKKMASFAWNLIVESAIGAFPKRVVA